MKRYTVGVIGTGRIGRLHTENLHHLPHVTVKAVCDPQLDQEWINALGLTAFEDHSLLMNDPEIEAVFICSPTPTHASLILEAVKVGKHIFCEKPIALDPAIIRECLEAVNQSGVKLQIGFNRRFDPNFARIKQVVSEGKIGQLHLLKITSRDPSPPPGEYIKDSGGIFLDMSIHDFDMARFLADSEVKEVYAMGAIWIDPSIAQWGDWDTTLITLKFENGAMGVIDNSRQAVYGYDQRVEAFGSLGNITAENILPTQTTLSTAEGVLTEKPLHFFLERYQTAYISEVRAFFDYLASEGDSPVSGDDGLKSILIGLAAAQSIKEQRPIFDTLEPMIIKQDDRDFHSFL